MTPPGSPGSPSSAGFTISMPGDFFPDSPTSSTLCPKTPHRPDKSKKVTPDKAWEEHGEYIVRQIAPQFGFTGESYTWETIREYDFYKFVMTHCVKLVISEGGMQRKLFLKIGKWDSRFRSLKKEGEIASLLTDTKTFKTPTCHSFFELQIENCNNIGVIVYEYMDDFEVCVDPTEKDRESLQNSFLELEDLGIVRMDIINNTKVTPSGEIIHFDFENDYYLPRTTHAIVYKKNTMEEFISFLLYNFVNGIKIPTPDL